MQSVLQVDGHLFPGNRQLKVWRPRHPQIGRRIRVVVEHLHANLCGDEKSPAEVSAPVPLPSPVLPLLAVTVRESGDAGAFGRRTAVVPS